MTTRRRLIGRHLPQSVNISADRASPRRNSRHQQPTLSCYHSHVHSLHSSLMTYYSSFHASIDVKTTFHTRRGHQLLRYFPLKVWIVHRLISFICLCADHYAMHYRSPSRTSNDNHQRGCSVPRVHHLQGSLLHGLHPDPQAVLGV